MICLVEGIRYKARMMIAGTMMKEGKASGTLF
jgi:hypothetical protein